MDFSRNEEQDAVAQLAEQILSDQCSPERLRELETSAEGAATWFAADAWRELAKADLLGLCLPTDVGGGGYGYLELAILLEAQGRHVAPIPLLETLVLGALPVAEFGSEAQRQALLPRVVSGEAILTAALREGPDPDLPSQPATTASREGDRWRVDGEKVLVPAAHLADRVLMPAATADGRQGVFLVDPRADGVTHERNVAPMGAPLTTLQLEGVVVGDDDVLGDPMAGAEIVDWIEARAVAGLCATQVGLCEGALRLTAGYVAEREQFGSKIGTFQAVAQRIADAYIDTEAIRLTALQVAWRLAEGLPVDDELHIAKFWAADGGHRVVHAAQHLHGGIGMDLDYPVHRYFRWTKTLEWEFGHARTHLRRLGARLAASPVP